MTWLPRSHGFHSLQGEPSLPAPLRLPSVAARAQAGLTQEARARACGADGPSLPHWKQQPCGKLWCRLPPTHARCCPQNCDAWKSSALGTAAQIPLAESGHKACLRIVGPQPEHEAHYYRSVFHNSIYGGTVFQVREKQTETCPFPVIAGDGL